MGICVCDHEQNTFTKSVTYTKKWNNFEPVFHYDHYTDIEPIEVHYKGDISNRHQTKYWNDCIGLYLENIEMYIYLILFMLKINGILGDALKLLVV